MQDFKKKIVAKLVKRMESAKSIVLVNYRGINISEVDELRSRMRNAEVDYFVAKNTYIKLALKELKISPLDKYLSNETAVAVSKKDEATSAKVICDFIKDVMGKKEFALKAGYVDGKLAEVEDLVKLAKLPSKDQLLALVLSTMNAPITSFVRLNSEIIKKAIYCIKEIAEKKGN